MKKINEEKIIKYVRSLILRSLTVIVVFLILAIVSKGNKQYKDIIVTNLYEKNISFTKIKNIYNKYLGGVVPLDKVTPNTSPVFNEQLEYTNDSMFHDGVKLEVINKFCKTIEVFRHAKKFLVSNFVEKHKAVGDKQELL